MPSRKKDFKPEIVIKTLLWSARHCCLCGKACSTGIEVAHIDQNGPATLDNAMPLCFDCHERSGNYDTKHPRGRRYRPAELRARRDQVYERYTSHLVPPLNYFLTQSGRTLPDVGFQIRHVGGPHWARVRVWITLARGQKLYGHPYGSSHYNGTFIWNLNPGFGVNGHFSTPREAPKRLATVKEEIRARIDVTVIDIYDRCHRLLPVGYVLNASLGEWYLEPSEEALDVPESKSELTLAGRTVK